MSKQSEYETMVGEQAFMDRALIELGAKAMERVDLGNTSQQYQLARAAGRMANQLLQERREYQRTGVTATYEQFAEAREHAETEARVLAMGGEK